MKGKYIFTTLLIFSIYSECLMAQVGLVRTNSNMSRPVLSTSNNGDLKGSPYLLEGWCRGDVKLENGELHKWMNLKYNQLGDELTFKGEDGKELAFAAPVVEFRLSSYNGEPIDRLFRNNFAPVKGSTKLAFYEVLYDGKIKLLKKNAKYVVQDDHFITEAATQSVSDKIKYYYVIDNQLTEFKNNKKSLAFFGNNSGKIQDYIDKNQLDLKRDSDLVKVFAYNESL